MAGARFDGTAAIEHLSGLVDAINDPSPLLAELGEYGLRSTRARFKSQTAPDGTAWAALQPWYQREKRRNKSRILTLNGYLRGQMTWQLVGDRTVEIGSNLPYAAVHQFGATIKPRAARVLMFRGHVAKSVTIPARPYLGLSDEDRSEIVERTLEWLQRVGK
ncbi:phage virion morphogenesis (putative tail completion) protein [Paenacidovorax caeni]|uniref:Phage virion morphogenesis (Putative tail completion) protein n=1 Tax=Paenacidovorax caeni TaxID=343013 RepID=A0A1I7JJU0_9BURK|nr:phage virion morphogenesis protein [Paenacidovorax caeni]SFU85430.1 phage virion morphogenesis (putative tail completion) protein [Paenacidovorax caeni]